MAPVKSAASRAAKAFLLAYAVASAVAIPFRCFVLISPDDDVAKLITAVTLFPLGLLQLLAVWQFANWLRYAYSRLPLLGWRARYTPGMAVATFLVPFSSLFKTADVVGEIIDGTAPQRMPRAPALARLPAPKFGSAWWYLFLASSAANDIASAVAWSSGRSHETRVIVLIIVAQILSAAAATLAVRFVEAIDARLKRCAFLIKRDGRPDIAEAIQQEPFFPSAGLASILQFVLVIGLGVDLIDIVVFIIAKPDRPIGEIAARSVLLANAAILLIAPMVFFCWVHRVARNGNQMGILSTSPALAVLGFAIPIYNLAHPWVLLQTFWRAVKPKDGTRTSSMDINVWWTCTILYTGLSVLAVFLRRDPSLHTTWLAVVLTSAMLALLAAWELYSAVFDISRELEPIETRFKTSQDTLARAALLNAMQHERESGTVPAVLPKRATWTEVLLPIAAAVDEGIATEAPEKVAERQLVDRHIEALQRAGKPLAYRSTASLTLALRVVMLLSTIVVELALLSTAINNWHFANSTFLFNVIVFGLLTAIVGLPTWAVFTYWVFRVARNLTVLAEGNGQPQAKRTALRFGLMFREASTLRALFDGAFGGVPSDLEPLVTVWLVALRIVQLTPVVLALALPRASSTALLAGFVLGGALAIWIAISAKLVRTLDQGVANLAAIESAPVAASVEAAVTSTAPTSTLPRTPPIEPQPTL